MTIYPIYQMYIYIYIYISLSLYIYIYVCIYIYVSLSLVIGLGDHLVGPRGSRIQNGAELDPQAVGERWQLVDFLKSSAISAAHRFFL